MPQFVVVTVSFSEKHSLDLALPYDVPSQTLAHAIARIMGLPLGEDGQLPYALLHVQGQRVRRLLPRETLGDAQVLYGDRLKITPAPEAPVRARVSSGDNRAYLQFSNGRTVPIDKSLLRIGRRGAEVPIDVDLSEVDDARVVSRHHATLTVRGHHYYLRDNGSRNGTRVNGKKLPQGKVRELHNGDIIQFGGPEGVTLSFIVRS